MTSEPKKVGRRTFLNYAIAVVATGVIVGAATYFAVPKGEVTVTAPGTTVTTTKTVTTTITGTPTTPPTTSSPTAKTTITFWQFVGKLTDEGYKLEIERFQELNPDIQVKFEIVPYEGFYEKILPALKAGVGPDVMEGDTGMLQPLMAEWCEPLDDYISGYREKRNHYDYAWELCEKFSKAAFNPDVKYYLAPMSTGIENMHYNQDAAIKYGLDINHPPSTWDDWLEWAKKLTTDEDKDGKIDHWGFAMEGQDVGIFRTCAMLPLSWDKNLHWFKQEPDPKSGLGYLNEKYVEGVKFLIDLYRVHGVTPPTTPTDTWRETETGSFPAGITRMINRGPFASYFAPPGTPGSTVNFHDGYMVMPQQPGGQHAGSAFQHNLVMFKTAKNKEAAWRFLEWLMSEEMQIIWATHGGVEFPVNKKAGEKFLELYPQGKVLIYCMENKLGYPSPYDTAFPLWNVDWQKAWQKALLGQLTPKEYVVECAKIHTAGMLKGGLITQEIANQYYAEIEEFSRQR